MAEEDNNKCDKNPERRKGERPEAGQGNLRHDKGGRPDKYG